MRSLLEYIKLKSLTWWMSFTPLALGLFLAFQNMHGLAEWVAVVNSLTGNVQPFILINGGLAGIGLRKAVG